MSAGRWLLGLMVAGALVYAGLAVALAPAATTGAAPEGLELPDSRRFLLGFTYQPHDWNPDAWQAAFRHAREHADLIAFFFDDGVPWDEARRGAPLPEALEGELARRAAGVHPGQRVLLAINPVGTDRVTPARYAEAPPDDPRHAAWSSRPWGDPELLEAYLAWCELLIARLDPDFLCYAFEVNSELHTLGPGQRQAFLDFLGEVYSRLKAAHPELPLFVEVALGDDAFMAERWAATEAVLAHSDLAGVSTYPYLFDVVGQDGAQVPADWFQRLQERVPGKRLVVSETGFLGGDFLHPQLGMWIPGRGKVLILGTEVSQAAYVRFLLAEAQRLEMPLVNWWVWRDLDALWEKIAGQGFFADAMAGQWNRAGLVDAAGVARTGQKVWDAWRALPRRPAAPPTPTP